MTAKIGIAITTYNRKTMLVANIALIQKLTASSFDLVICDDGSSDGTVEAVQNLNVRIIQGKNKGVAWNKNRGLFYLNSFSNCDYVLALDDDVCPRVYGWDLEWIAACKRFGHITINYDNRGIISGTRTAQNVGISTEVCGQCLSFRRDVLASVGYFDLRFGQYGHEHTDMSNRCIRAGYGGVWSKQHGRCFFVIHGGLDIAPATSNIDAESLQRNVELLRSLSRESIYRPAWRNDTEFHELRSEVVRAIPDGDLLQMVMNFDEQAYLVAHPDVARANIDPLQHYVRVGFTERRKLGS